MLVAVSAVFGFLSPNSFNMKTINGLNSLVAFEWVPGEQSLIRRLKKSKLFKQALSSKDRRMKKNTFF